MASGGKGKVRWWEKGDEDEPSGLMHISVVESHETGAQQWPVAEQSAPRVLGPAVHTSDGAESVAEGDPAGAGSDGVTDAWICPSEAWLTGEEGLGSMLPREKVGWPQHCSRGR